MRLLALDQATITSGYAIFENGKLIKHGLINISKSKPLPERMVIFKKELINLLETQEIDAVVFEDVHLEDMKEKGPQTFKILAEWLGALIELLTELSYPNSALLPNTWRSILNINTGDQHRGAKKKRAQDYVLKHYGKSVTEDEADAICIGAAYILKDTPPVSAW